MDCLPRVLMVCLNRQSLLMVITQCRTLEGVLERSGVQTVQELRDMRWSLTQSLGIDYSLAGAIAQGLDQF